MKLNDIKKYQRGDGLYIVEINNEIIFISPYVKEWTDYIQKNNLYTIWK